MTALMGNQFQPGKRVTDEQARARLHALLVEHDLLRASPGEALAVLKGLTVTDHRPVRAQDLVTWLGGYPEAATALIQAGTAADGPATLLAALINNAAVSLAVDAPGLQSILQRLTEDGVLPDGAIEALRQQQETQVPLLMKEGLGAVNAAAISRAKRNK